ncbi:MAG TPA: 6-carboxytetrahydropterin synthase [Bacteroidota bacterium]|nr:6-carboxytetrahydropterin synthase [Bacteroidota bacterium]
MYVTRRSHFSAAHRLYNPQLSEKENLEIYDKCSNPNGHGHNYYLEVTVAGDPDPRTGYVIDLKKLKQVIEENFISKVDHKHLNLDVDFLKDVVPTAENIAIACWNQLAPKIKEGRLHSIRLQESHNNSVEYKGQE